jgi:hypothetical protein
MLHSPADGARTAPGRVPAAPNAEPARDLQGDRRRRAQQASHGDLEPPVDGLVHGTWKPQSEDRARFPGRYSLCQRVRGSTIPGPLPARAETAGVGEGHASGAPQQSRADRLDSDLTAVCVCAVSPLGHSLTKAPSATATEPSSPSAPGSSAAASRCRVPSVDPRPADGIASSTGGRPERDLCGQSPRGAEVAVTVPSCLYCLDARSPSVLPPR